MNETPTIANLDDNRDILAGLKHATAREWFGYLAARIAPKSSVSAEVLAERLRVEKLWPPN